MLLLGRGIFITGIVPKIIAGWKDWLRMVETRTWTLFFVTPKYSDSMQFYTMLLEQFGYKPVKDQGTATWLVEVQMVVYLVAWLDSYFVFT